MIKKEDNILRYEGLGDIIIKPNARAKRFVFRVKDNRLQMTTPKYSSKKEMYQAVSSMYDKLKKLLSNNTNPLIDLNFSIDTEFFKLKIEEGNRERFLARSELGELSIIAPKSVDFNDVQLQEWLKRVIIEALRRNAKIILAPRLYMLSQKHNIPYNQLKINTNEGRWGSCSGRKNINLSVYLVLLPKHLIDYVLLHELCHTYEMNHGPNFWALLNNLTEGRAEELNEELKNYHTSIFNYSKE